MAGSPVLPTDLMMIMRGGVLMKALVADLPCQGGGGAAAAGSTIVSGTLPIVVTGVAGGPYVVSLSIAPLGPPP